MSTTHWIAACFPLVASVVAARADSPPEMVISNEFVRARVLLPDAKTGFYRGTRFDWSGVLMDLEYAGHNYYPQWFARMDPKVVDFTYEGADIVAGRCTAITGPCEEFSTDGKALGYDAAKPGGTFIKIGVGVLRKPNEARYSMFRTYDLADPGKWTVRPRVGGVEFEQVVEDRSTGYAYDYRKALVLTAGKPQLVLEHTLRNTGQHAIRTSVYNHNFLYLDRQPPGPDLTVSLPFQINATPKLDADLAEVRGRQIRFVKTLAGEDRVYSELRGYGAGAQDYDVRVENEKSGAGVRITSDRPLVKLAMWSIRAPMCVEPFIDLAVEPGAEASWRIVYDYFAR